MGKIIHELKKVSGRFVFPALIPKKPNSEKVLIIKDNSIGDFLLFSGILNFYIRHFGDKAYCLVNSNVEEAAKLYTNNVIVMDNKKYFASFKNRYNLLDQLNDIGFGTAINSILNSSESRDMLHILKIPMTYLYDGKYIAFSFSSASLKKNYPADKFMEVIGYLHRRLNIKAILIGHDQYGSVELPDFIIDLRGKTSLIDAFSIIKHSRFFIGNETGTTHEIRRAH